MPLADLLIATEEVARAGAKDIPVPGRYPSPEDDRIDIKGVVFVPMSTLFCLLTHQTWQSEIMRRFELVYEGSSDGPWIRRLPKEFAQALAELTDHQLDDVATKWAATEELEGLEKRRPGIIKQVLVLIVGLSQRAQRQGKGMFLWESL